MGTEITENKIHPLDYLLEDKYHLWKTLEQKAGGTAAHSRVVADLCGKIASEINIDEKIMRVAGRFHDIGKTRYPSFFVENQRTEENIHDVINNPFISSQLISRHVGDSLVLLVNENIPNEYLTIILRIIAQHHSGGITDYFWNLAKKNDSNEDILDYSYFGQEPQSREAALLTIIDILEATTKAVFSATTTSDVSLKEIIDNTIDKLLDENRIGVLTLNDAKIIREITAKEFTNMYHSRIRYEEGED